MKASIAPAARQAAALKRRKRARGAVYSLCRAVILAGLSFVLLYPILYIFSMAFRPSDQVLDPLVVWIPQSFTMANIRQAFSGMQYMESLWQSVRISLVSSLLSVAVYSLVGYGFARFSFRLKKLCFAILIFTIILPPQALLIPQYLENSYFDFFFIGRLVGLFTGTPLTVNILDSVWAFYLPAICGFGVRSGILIFIFIQFYRGLPKELEDAAYIDGCGPLRPFLRIMLPNALPALITVLLFSVVWYWNDYQYAGMFLVDNQTLPLRLSNLKMVLNSAAGQQLDPYQLSVLLPAGCLLVILPPLILYIIFQRYFTESIERTGLVG